MIQNGIKAVDSAPAPHGGLVPPPPVLLTQYFCVPDNDKLTELRDTVADRLFKIRNCMNIDGVVRDLALFEPPIDPALLVLAAAAGVDIESVLNDLSAGTLPYRFQIVHSRAMDLASGVASLGQSLLQAFEKRDAETLARMRSGQEIDVLKAVRATKVLEVKEGEQALAAAEEAQAVIQTRFDHYTALIAAGLNEVETLSFTLHASSAADASTGQSLSSAASAIAFLPDFTVGAAGFSSPVAESQVSGGEKIALSLRMAAEASNSSSARLRASGEVTSTAASYLRRAEEWSFQADLAKAELKQSAKQIAAAKIRVAIASSALDAHDLQIDNAKAVDEFMRDKLTNEDLYDWMSDRITDIYYEAYKLAYDMAKRAEKAFQVELAIDGAPTYVTFGYWDSAKQGLTSGEQLLHALRGLEVAYHEQNKRELEITKHVSLATFFPVALIKLRETGECDISLPERLFAYDFSSHYLRRLRQVSLTVDGVSGPYTGVNCTLRLKSSEVRRKASMSATPASATAPTLAIATSSGQMDSGLFETNLRDDRYLPFEGAGAVGAWHLSIPRKANAFDLRTVSDAVLHLRYTARDGGQAFASAVETDIGDDPHINYVARPALYRLIDVRADFSLAWETFVSTAAADVPLRYADFQFLAGDNSIFLTAVAVYVRKDVAAELAVHTVSGGDAVDEIVATGAFAADPWSGTLEVGSWSDGGSAGDDIEIKPSPGVGDIDALRLSIDSSIDAAKVKEIYVVLTYKQTTS